MITTSNGTYAPDASPFMQRPWTWAFSGLQVDQSRDARTVIVGTVATANVQTESFTYAVG